MILVDANLLLYAYHPESPQHAASRGWLEGVLNGSATVRFAWVTIWAFLRIATSPRVFERPLLTAEASAAVTAWLACPAVDVLEPGDRHWEILAGLLDRGQATGPLVMDAVLAALALEYGATLYTTDRDFARFSELPWTNPLEPPTGPRHPGGRRGSAKLPLKKP